MKKSFMRSFCFMIAIVLLFSLVGCGGSKTYDEQIVGNWTFNGVYNDGDPKIFYLNFHDDGTVSSQWDGSSIYDWYYWSIIDGTTLKVKDDERDWVALYDIEIKGKSMTMTLRDDSEADPFDTGTLTKTE